MRLRGRSGRGGRASAECSRLVNAASERDALSPALFFRPPKPHAHALSHYLDLLRRGPRLNALVGLRLVPAARRQTEADAHFCFCEEEEKRRSSKGSLCVRPTAQTNKAERARCRQACEKGYGVCAGCVGGAGASAAAETQEWGTSERREGRTFFSTCPLLSSLPRRRPRARTHAPSFFRCAAYGFYRETQQRNTGHGAHAHRPSLSQTRPLSTHIHFLSLSSGCERSLE